MISIKPILSDVLTCIVSNCRIVGGDIGIDATGNAICDTVSIGACQRRGMLLASQTFDSHPGCVLIYSFPQTLLVLERVITNVL